MYVRLFAKRYTGISLFLTVMYVLRLVFDPFTKPNQTKPNQTKQYTGETSDAAYPDTQSSCNHNDLEVITCYRDCSYSPAFIDDAHKVSNSEPDIRPSTIQTSKTDRLGLQSPALCWACVTPLQQPPPSNSRPGPGRSYHNSQEGGGGRNNPKAVGL